MSSKARLSRLSSVRRLQDLERQSSSQGHSGPLAFAHACLGCCGVCALFCLSCVLIVALSGTGLAKLVIGALYLDSCEAAPMVPVFLLVGSLVPVLHGCTCRAEKDEGGKVKVSCQGVRCVIGSVVVLFEVSWLLAMTVIVVRTRAQVAALPPWCSDPSLRNISTISFPVSTTPTSPSTTPTPPSTTDNPPSTAINPLSTTTTPPSTTTAAPTGGSSDAITTSRVTSDLPATTSSTVTSRPRGSGGEPCLTCDPFLLTFAFAMVVLELVLVCVFVVAGLCVCCMYGVAVCTKE